MEAWLDKNGVFNITGTGFDTPKVAIVPPKKKQEKRKREKPVMSETSPKTPKVTYLVTSSEEMPMAPRKKKEVRKPVRHKSTFLSEMLSKPRRRASLSKQSASSLLTDGFLYFVFVCGQENCHDFKQLFHMWTFLPTARKLRFASMQEDAEQDSDKEDEEEEYEE